METKVNTIVFDGDGYQVDNSLLSNLSEEYSSIVKEMMLSGHYQDGIDISKFLNIDLSIDIEKLALATVLSVIALEAKTPDNDATLLIKGFDTYCSIRGITDNERKIREEKIFILAFITGEAMEASHNDTLVVKYAE